MDAIESVAAEDAQSRSGLGAAHRSLLARRVAPGSGRAI